MTKEAEALKKWWSKHYPESAEHMLDSEFEEMAKTVARRDAATPTPVWIRAPKNGLCPHCSLTRSALYRLADERLIRTACIKQIGKGRGIRLFHLPSILELIESNSKQ